MKFTVLINEAMGTARVFVFDEKGRYQFEKAINKSPESGEFEVSEYETFIEPMQIQPGTVPHFEKNEAEGWQRWVLKNEAGEVVAEGDKFTLEVPKPEETAITDDNTAAEPVAVPDVAESKPDQLLAFLAGLSEEQKAALKAAL